VVFAIYLVFAGLYVAIAGLWYFNISVLTHAQFQWGALRYLASVAQSLGLAIIPAGVLYLVSRLSRRPDAPGGKVCLLTTAVFHIAMAGFYLPIQVPVE
jgi:hypothetical protein